MCFPPNLKIWLRACLLVHSVSISRTDDSRSVELLNPPEESEPGDRVFFESLENAKPEERLNPKKKVWEKVQVRLFICVVFIGVRGRGVGGNFSHTPCQDTGKIGRNCPYVWAIFLSRITALQNLRIENSILVA